MKEAYKDWTLDDIIAWCQANKQVDWLKTVANHKVKRPIYPKIPHISKKGKHTMVYDKTAEPIGYKEDTMSFVEIKKAFIGAFFPEQFKQEEEVKGPNMWDRINSL